MKFIDEYRDGESAGRLATAIARTVTRPWTIMEVCGGQTHTIVKYGVDRLLPPEVELVHGPGCPVCVTSLEMIDRAHAILRKCHESVTTKEKCFADNAERIVACCTAMAKAFDAGGRLFVMGNGGSSCDAAHVPVEFMHPIIEKRPALPALALTTDTALLTAVGNDQDFSLAFVQQLRVLGRRGDMALSISTSGKSANINRALQAAREMGLLTVGFSGRDGGRMPEHCEYCFTVPSFSIHRIQETHETLLHVLWDLIHVICGEEDVI